MRQDDIEKYTRLEVLRNITTLNPVDYAKVLKARKAAEAFKKIYMQYEPTDDIEVDYSAADDLEIALREQTLERREEKNWRKYLNVENDGYGLHEWTEDLIQQNIEALNKRKGR